MPNPTPDEIQQQMREVRTDLRENVQSLVANAREMTDWTSYVRRYPWLCVGAAAAIGFLLVPSKRAPAAAPALDAKALEELLKSGQLGDKLVVKVEQPVQKPGLGSVLVRTLANSLLQGGMAIASKQLDEFLAGLAQRPNEPRREEP